MAEVHAVAIFRVKPGRYADLFEALRPVKKTFERLGANVSVVRQAFGAETGSVVVSAATPTGMLSQKHAPIVNSPNCLRRCAVTPIRRSTQSLQDCSKRSLFRLRSLPFRSNSCSRLGTALETASFVAGPGLSVRICFKSNLQGRPISSDNS